MIRSNTCTKISRLEIGRPRGGHFACDDSEKHICSLVAVDMTDALANLGSYTQKIATTSPECQAWLDRGMVWAYNLHREEALHCFLQAAEADPVAWRMMARASSCVHCPEVRRP